MALKFFQIGKANEEIDRLELANAELTRQIEAFKGNDSEVVAAAEKIKGELAASGAKVVQLESDLATARLSITSLTGERDAARTELATANGKLANPDQRIKDAAAVQAAQITASLGQPPVTAQPAVNPAAPANPEVKGRDRFLAAIKIEGQA